MTRSMVRGQRSRPSSLVFSHREMPVCQGLSCTRATPTDVSELPGVRGSHLGLRHEPPRLGVANEVPGKACSVDRPAFRRVLESFGVEAFSRVGAGGAGMALKKA